MALRKLKLAEDTRSPKDHLQSNLVNLINAVIYYGYPQGKDYVLEANSIEKIKNVYQAVNKKDRWATLKHMFKLNKNVLMHHKITLKESGDFFLGNRQILVEPTLPLKEYLEST